MESLISRIHLNVDFALPGEVEVLHQHGHQSASLGFIQIGGVCRPSAAGDPAAVETDGAWALISCSRKSRY